MFTILQKTSNIPNIVVIAPAFPANCLVELEFHATTVYLELLDTTVVHDFFLHNYRDILF